MGRARDDDDRTGSMAPLGAAKQQAASWWAWCEDELVGPPRGHHARGLSCGRTCTPSAADRDAVLSHARELQEATAAGESALFDAGLPEVLPQIVPVYDAARRVEGAVTVGTAVFSSFVRRGAADAALSSKLRRLVLRAVAIRTATKELLAQKLLRSPAPESAAALGLKVRAAEGMGRGLFATRALEEGVVIGQYTGDVLDVTDFVTRYPDGGKERGDYVVRVSPEWWIDAACEARSNHTRFINHADAPNVGAFGDELGDAPRLVLFTLKPVAAGEQLLLDYGPGYWEGRAAPPVQACGASASGDEQSEECDAECGGVPRGQRRTRGAPSGRGAGPQDKRPKR